MRLYPQPFTASLQAGLSGRRLAVHAWREASSRRLSSRAGFTLIELLTGIAILCILAALLLPALSRGRGTAYRVRCVSNLRQLAVASHMYWDDNNGTCFRYRVGTTNDGEWYWFGWLGPGAEGQRAYDPTAGALYPYLRGRGVELCPSFDYLSPQVKLKAKGAAYGYGYNWYLSSSAAGQPVKISRVSRPGEIALLADAAQVNTWQAPASPTNPMLEEWYYVDNSTNQPNGHFRHMRRANVVFCDGHVAAERSVPGTLDLRMPQQYVGLLRKEILLVP